LPDWERQVRRRLVFRQAEWPASLRVPKMTAEQKRRMTILLASQPVIITAAKSRANAATLRREWQANVPSRNPFRNK
jgi:hypothetical protein